MKLFFTTFFRKTFLLACFLSIFYHCFYFDIYDLPYLLAIKIVLLIIAAIEFVGMILYLKDSHTKKKKGTNQALFKSYTTIRLLFYYSFTIYIFLPKGYSLLNFYIVLLFGIYLGYRMAIKKIQHTDRKKE